MSLSKSCADGPARLPSGVYRLLELDSGIMNRKVGLILPGDLKPGELMDILYRMDQEGFELIYWKTPQAREHHTPLYRNRLSATNIDYDLPLSLEPEHHSEPSGIRAFHSQLDAEALKSLAGACSAYSHLSNNDLIEKSHVRELYYGWITRAVSSEGDAGILLYERGSEILGLIVYSHTGDQTHIDLLYTQERYRNAGIAGSLVEAVRRRGVSGKRRVMTVTAQKANTAACSFYESRGFSKTREYNIFHFWKDRLR